MPMLAILYSPAKTKEFEKTFSQDMTTLSEYLQTWRQELSHIKTVTAAFQIYNREVKRDLKFHNTSKILSFVQSNWTEHLRTVLI